MPPKMGLRVSSCFHNAFSAVDCQEISGRFWPLADFRERPLQAKSFAEHWRSNKPASSCNYELGA